MSLIRQIWILLALTMLLAFVGATEVSVLSARRYLETQLSQKNNDSAQSMALTLSQLKGDRTAIELSLASQFDTGSYQRLRLIGADGRGVFDRQMPVVPSTVPDWFIGLLSIRPEVGMAQVSNGWTPVGQLEVRSDVSFAHQALWASTVRILLCMGFLAVVACLMAALGLRRIRQPLAAAVAQAQALTERRFITVPEPEVPELRGVTRAMNTMVERLHLMFDEQASQVEQLRRQAHCDPITGLSNRAYFMSRLKSWLSAEDGSASGALILMRLCDLSEVNRRLGRVRTDSLLQAAADALTESARRSPAFELGRLNGADFALVLPDAGPLREPAVDVAARLRGVLRAQDDQATAVVGAVRWHHGASLSSVLASADQALARAESRGNFAVELDDAADGHALGEDAWRLCLEAALTAGRVRLVSHPLVDAQGALLQLECPLRLKPDPDGEWMPAAQWLPMARRTQMTARIDLAAVSLALQAIATDPVIRSVNFSAASLLDAGFLPGLRQLLQSHRDQASLLWLELPEAGAWRHVPLLRELIAQVRTLGVRVGLEHAGEQVTDAPTMLGLGVEFLKLDASFTEGLAQDSARAQHVATTVRMLHGLGLRVYAEGVQDPLDAAALVAAGLDGLTGPVVPQ